MFVLDFFSIGNLLKPSYYILAILASFRSLSYTVEPLLLPLGGWLRLWVIRGYGLWVMGYDSEIL